MKRKEQLLVNGKLVKPKKKKQKILLMGPSTIQR